jgi:hypothetical protein
MAAEDTDKFIVATFALWAGDLEYAERLLREYSPTRVGSPSEQRARSAEDLIRVTASLRLRQIWQKRGEFNSIPDDESGEKVAGTPLIIDTPHLRAALWRLDDREFLLLGFLKDLGWEQALFKRARSRSNAIGPEAHDDGQVDPPPTEQAHSIDWVVEGNPFLRVSVTGMGLIEANALWVHAELPGDAAAIVEPLKNLMGELDPSDDTRDHR